MSHLMDGLTENKNYFSFFVIIKIFFLFSTNDSIFKRQILSSANKYTYQYSTFIFFLSQKSTQCEFLLHVTFLK